jgi:hypothetical protein
VPHIKEGRKERESQSLKVEDYSNRFFFVVVEILRYVFVDDARELVERARLSLAVFGLERLEAKRRVPGTAEKNTREKEREREREREG